MAPDTTRAAGIAAQVWPTANPVGLETQMALAEAERALIAQAAVRDATSKALQYATSGGVPAVNREAAVGHNAYNMPGSREAWERYGVPPVMVQSDPWARIAYRQNPNGSVTPLIGFGSVYPHVVRGVNDPSAPPGLARWHYLIDQVRQQNPYRGLAAQLIQNARKTGGGQPPAQQKPPAKDQPAQQQPQRGLKISGPSDVLLLGPLVKQQQPVQQQPVVSRPEATTTDDIVSSNIGVWGASGRDVIKLRDQYKDVPLPPPTPPNVRLLPVDEIEADPDFTGYVHEPEQTLATQIQQATATPAQMQQADVQQQVSQAGVQQQAATGQQPSGVTTALNAGLPLVGATVGGYLGKKVGAKGLGATMGAMAGTKIAEYLTGYEPSMIDYALNMVPATASLLRSGARAAPRVVGGQVVPQTALPAGSNAAAVQGGRVNPALPSGGGTAAPLPGGPVTPVLPYNPTFQLTPAGRAALANRAAVPQLPAAPVQMGTTATPYPTIPVPPNMPTGPAIQIPHPVFSGTPGFAQTYVLPSAIR